MSRLPFWCGAGICLAFLVSCGDAPRSDGESPSGGTRERAPAEPAAAPSATQLLVETTDAWGLRFTHDAGAGGELLFPEMMGGGVAIFDADADGDLDVYLVSGAPELGASSAPRGPINRLFLQDDAGVLADATEGSGLGDPGYGTGVAVGDIDNDGLDDVFVANYGADRLFRSRGRGRFEDVSAAAGVQTGLPAAEDWSTSAAFCDFDRDGWLDLYIARYVVFERGLSCTDKTGRREYCGPDNYADRTDRLLRNRGDGTFADVTTAAGIEAASGAGLGVVCADVDGDSWVDVYVANDGDPNQLWINQRGSDDTLRFVDDAVIMGASVNASGLDEAGMGVVAADFDNDADLDLFLTHLRDETNTFYRNLGSGVGFEDRTIEVGLASESTAYTGFGTAPLDLDLDGDLDLVIVNGRVKHAEPLTDALPAPWNIYAEPNLVYRNDAGTFTLLRDPVASFSRQIEIGRGLATGDLDGDGDLDLVLNNLESAARIYRGEPPPGHWLLVDVLDPRLGRRALGAVVVVESEVGEQLRTVQSAMSYLSASDPRAHFGLGSRSAPVTVRVRWPDGLEERFVGIEVDRAIVLRRGEGDA